MRTAMITIIGCKPLGAHPAPFACFPSLACPAAPAGPHAGLPIFSSPILKWQCSRRRRCRRYRHVKRAQLEHFPWHDRRRQEDQRRREMHNATAHNTTQTRANTRRGANGTKHNVTELVKALEANTAVRNIVLQSLPNQFPE